MRMHPSSIWVAVTQVYVQKEIHQGLFLRFMNLLIYNILYIYIYLKKKKWTVLPVKAKSHMMAEKWKEACLVLLLVGSKDDPYVVSCHI